uniref:Predicted nucleic acid-binding protein, contains PIN domain n=1 Tax=Candidatus Kentrum sp. FW TaxID=2126338 RepID=A0A450TCR2_9GAMM|nr:MAG: Predicted nucleic acid-binding protein, contains PIN domain [Candidatus Kentron sp. FW]
MVQKIYIETSVISYLVAKPSKNLVIAAHQLSTMELWNRLNAYEVFVSKVVIDEVSKGDAFQAKRRLEMLREFQVLAIDHEIVEIARRLISEKVIPSKCPEDALHIAVAAANGMDVIVTWNFKHINNPSTRKKVRWLLEGNDWKCPEICSPEEFLGDEV